MADQTKQANAKSRSTQGVETSEEARLRMIEELKSIHEEQMRGAGSQQGTSAQRAVKAPQTPQSSQSPQGSKAGEKRPQPKSQTKKKSKPQIKKSGFTLRRLVVQIVIIVLLLVVGSVAAHFTLRLITRHSVRLEVPNFIGLDLSGAQSMAERLDLNIIINDSLHAPAYRAGEVLDQLPRGGVEVKPGRSVYIVINAFNAKRAEVPFVAGRSLRQAKNMLEVAGFEIKRIEYRPDMATNYVLDEYLGSKQITSSTKLMEAVGSGVTLHVGRSVDTLTTAVPLVIGLTEREAKGRLWEAGLNIGSIEREKGIDASNIADARVYAQSLESQSQSLLGTDVSFSLTLDEKRVEQVLEELRKAQIEREKYEKYVKDSLAQIKIERASTPRPKVEVEDDFNFCE